MQQKISLKILPFEAADEAILKRYIANTSGKRITDISGYKILKRSIDARGKNIWINLTINAFIHEPVNEKNKFQFNFKDVSTVIKK